MTNMIMIPPNLKSWIVEFWCHQSFRNRVLSSSLNCFIEHSSGPEGADHASVTYQSSLFSRMRSCDNMATGATTSHSNLQWRSPLCSAAGGGSGGMSDSKSCFEERYIAMFTFRITLTLRDKRVKRKIGTEDSNYNYTSSVLQSF